MKIKIKPFLKRLIKENIYYIIGNIFIFILIIMTIKIGVTENENYNRKISSLELENIELMNKATLMNSTIPKTDKLDEDVLFLNTLIPIQKIIFHNLCFENYHKNRILRLLVIASMLRVPHRKNTN